MAFVLACDRADAATHPGTGSGSRPMAFVLACDRADAATHPGTGSGNPPLWAIVT
jgi:hypothetical protein